MFRFTLPFLMMWMTAQPAAHAFDISSAFPGYAIDLGEPRPTCGYSFYWALINVRQKLQITDNYNNKIDCDYQGVTKTGTYQYKCSNGNFAMVAVNYYGAVQWVHYQGEADVTAYCY